jgi:ABC-type glycerol-3-phosphate transport system permease component
MATLLKPQKNQHPARGKTLPVWLRDLRHDMPIHIVLMLGLAISCVPLFFMLLISVKSQGQYLTQPLGLTFPFEWSNYTIAFNVLRRSIMTSLGLVAINVTGTLLLASLAAYAFARFQFPGRELLFWLILGILFIPGIMTLAPSYLIAKQLNILNTWFVLTLPTIAGAQASTIFMLRAFFISISQDLVDAARVDGAGPLTVLWKIVLPLSRPILATMAVLQSISIWNDWVWANVTIKDAALRPMALQVFYLASSTGVGGNVGQQMAGYTIASIPLILVFIFLSKQFIEGLSSGALKW